MPTDWIFGLSASGKTTYGKKLLQERGENSRTVFLDGDELRSGVCRDLNHTRNDRIHNTTRIAHLCNLLMDQGFDVIVCAMTPYQKQRDLVNSILRGRLTWHFMDTPLAVCKERDTKNIYGNRIMVPGESDTFDPPIEKGQILVA